MQQILDTMVLVAALNPKDALHQQASRYIELVGRDPEFFVPFVCIIELDLVMKGREYSIDERKDVFEWLGGAMPETKVISNPPLSLSTALDLQERGMGYFDSLVSALAIESNAAVVTRDSAIAGVAKTKW